MHACSAPPLLLFNRSGSQHTHRHTRRTCVHMAYPCICVRPFPFPSIKLPSTTPSEQLSPSPNSYPTYLFFSLVLIQDLHTHTHTHAHAHAIEGRSERGRGYLRNGNGMGGDGLVCWDPWIRSICTICILQASCPRMIIFFLSLRSPVAFSFFFYTSTYKLYVIIHVYTVVLVLLDLSTHMWICLIITISPHGPLFLSSNRQRNRRG